MKRKINIPMGTTAHFWGATWKRVPKNEARRAYNAGRRVLFNGTGLASTVFGVKRYCDYHLSEWEDVQAAEYICICPNCGCRSTIGG